MAATTSRRRHVHLGLTALLMLTTLLASLAAPEAAEARNAPKVRDKTITMPIDVYLLPGAAADFPARLQSAFDTYWGEGNGFEYKCYDVVFKLDMKVVRTLPPDDAPRHRVVVGPVPEGERGRPHVDYGPNTQRNSRPTQDSYQGNFTDHYKIDKVWAHELGHFMGLNDEYSDNGERGTERRTRPWPGADKDGVPYKDSLMADGGPVRQRYIDQIVERHFPDGPPKCKIHARQEMESSWEIGGAVTRHISFRGVLEVWAEPDEDGTLTGTATFMVDETKSTGTDPCGGGGGSYYDLTGTVEGRNLTVAGQWEGDRVELEVTGEVVSTWGGGATDCEGGSHAPAGEYTGPLMVPVPLEGDLADDRYEDEQVVDYGGGYTITVHTVIEAVPADEEGEAVG